MNAIWKYPLEVVDEQIIQMPGHASIVSVQVQYGTPCLWAVVNPATARAQSQRGRKIRIVGTGHDFDASNLKYIGTFQLLDGKFVGHVFEDMSPRA